MQPFSVWNDDPYHPSLWAFWDLTVAARDCVDGETTNSWLPEALGKWLHTRK